MLSLIFLGLLGGLYIYIKRPVTNLFFEDPRLKEGVSEFLDEVRDAKENGFKIDKQSPVSLRAIFYATIINKMFLQENMKERIDVEAMFDRIRSHYVSPGYYVEEGENPVFTTAKALSIDIQYQEDLDQEIDLNWLKENSLENKDLEPIKLDPEYQHAVIQIYKLLGMPDKVKELSVPFLNYYCNFQTPEDISDKEFIRQRAYQIAIIHLLGKMYRSPESCLNQKDAEATKERLSKIQFSDLDNMEEVFYLCHLKLFFRAMSLKDEEFGNVFRTTEDFYSGGAFKEYLSDQEPNLIGTHYAVKLIMQFYYKYIINAPIEI